MATRLSTAGVGRPTDGGLLAREIAHRASNDLQLIVGLLFSASRRAEGEETKTALQAVAERVAMIGRARSATGRNGAQSLDDALAQVCDALRPLAEARHVTLALRVDTTARLSPDRIATLALAVNELATNAIKHAFPDGAAGMITIAVADDPLHGLVVTVEDDGAPFATHPSRSGAGNGLGLVRALLETIDALLIAPEAGSKRYEIRVGRG